MNTRKIFLKTFVTISIITGACWALSLGFASMAGQESYPKTMLSNLDQRLNGEKKEIHESVSLDINNIHLIDITTDTADIEFTTHELPDLRVDLEGSFHSSQPLTTSISDHTMSIQVAGKRQSKWNSIIGNVEFKSSARLRFFIPKAFTKNMKVNTKSGNIKTSTIQIGGLDIWASSGDIHIESTQLNKLNLDTGSGDVNISGKIDEIKTRTGSGDVHVNSLTSESLQIRVGSGDIVLQKFSATSVLTNTGSGDVTASIHDPHQWSIQTKTGSGKITNEFQDAQGKNRMIIETGSGDISITR